MYKKCSSVKRYIRKEGQKTVIEEVRSNITVAGGGYVGLPLACMLAEENNVILYDIDHQKVDQINHGSSPISEPGVINWFASHRRQMLHATTSMKEAYQDADLVVIAAPTDFDKKINTFDTTHVEKVIRDTLEYLPSQGASKGNGPLIVIRSTVPIGFTEKMRASTGYSRIMFGPEFLREGTALEDILSPSRVIIGTDINDPKSVRDAEWFLELIQRSCLDDAFPTLIMSSSEAEAVKLFSNTYLAMRIAFFNELDGFAEINGLDPEQIIYGMGLDHRIGDYYNNPSFGYGGYCLPKDSRQLLSHCRDFDCSILPAIVESNDARMDFITNQVLRKAARLEETGISPEDIRIGVYRINMKKGSDNYRQSASLEVLRRIAGNGYTVQVYEPLLDTIEGIPDCSIQNDIERFKNDCHIIIANRYDSCLDDVREKVYTRDLFHNN